MFHTTCLELSPYLPDTELKESPCVNFLSVVEGAGNVEQRKAKLYHDLPTQTQVVSILVCFLQAFPCAA